MNTYRVSISYEPRTIYVRAESEADIEEAFPSLVEWLDGPAASLDDAQEVTARSPLVAIVRARSPLVSIVRTIDGLELR